MYDAALFVHIVGVVMLVIGLAYSLGGFAMATRARTVGDVRRSLALVPIAERVIPVGMILLPLTGLYMASRHGGNGSIAWNNVWLDLAMGVFVVMSGLGPAVESKRIIAILEAANHAAESSGGEAPLPEGLRAQLADPVLRHVAGFGACQVGAFLWLMTNKPATVPAVLTVAIAAVVSVGVARLFLPGAKVAGTVAGAAAVEPAAEALPAS